MIRGLLLVVGLGFAGTAFAEDGRADRVGKDMRDGVKDASDSTQDALHTDSGLHKARRHVKREGRHFKKEVRDDNARQEKY